MKWIIRIAAVAPLATLFLAGCLGMYGMEGAGESEFDRDPRSLLPDSPPIAVKIERMGLEGHVPHDAPTVVEFVLTNNGPARDVRVEIHEWPPPLYNSWAKNINGDNEGPRLHLEANRQSRHRWILPRLGYSQQMDPGAEMLMVVQGDDDTVMGVGAIPDFKRADRHVAIIASGEDVGLDVQQSVNRADMGQGGFSGRYSVALILKSPPDLWYEWDSTAAVILARPWSDLTGPEQTALSRYVVYGGTIHILPEYCADWRAIEIATDAVPGDLPTITGAGQVYVARTDLGANNTDRGAWFTRTLPNWNKHRPSWDATQPGLSLVYTMPDAALMIGIIVLIIVIMGPVAHLVLIRLKKRELAWIALPLLSLLLAGCMYAVASNVKGEEAALESHHMVMNFAGTDQAVATTGLRIQSASAGERDLRVEAEHPHVSSNLYLYQAPGHKSGTLTVDEHSFAAEEIPMHRFSSQDFYFTAPVPPVPIDISAPQPNSVTITNTSPAPYTDLYLRRPHGWIKLADKLDPGKTRTWKDLGLGKEAHMLLDVEYDSKEAIELTSTLNSATYRIEEYRNTVEATLLVAGCEASGLPRAKMSPAPTFKKSSVHCSWYLPGAVPVPSASQVAGGRQ